MIQHHISRKGLAEMIGFVMIFMIVVMLSLFMFMLNALAGNSQSVSADSKIEFQADKIRLRSSVTRLMIGKLWRAETVPYGEYGDQKAYKVFSKYLSTEQGEKLWLNGTAIAHSEADKDIKNYIELVMDRSYGNLPYQVKLINKTGAELSVGSVSSPSRVSYPIALQNGTGRVSIYVESGDILNVR